MRLAQPTDKPAVGVDGGGACGLLDDQAGGPAEQQLRVQAFLLG